jgi:type II secretory pathway component PulL
MYAIANELINEKDLPFDILLPLINETASKVKNMTPRAAQTGPALRLDKNVMQDHTNMLNGKPRLKKIYNQLSENINEFHKIPKI